MFKKTRARIRTGIHNAFNPSLEHLSGLNDDLRYRITWLKARRSPELQRELEEDFSRVLAAWGIAGEREIPVALRMLRLRTIVFCIPVVLGGVVLSMWSQSGDTLFLFAGLPFLVVGLLGCLTTVWRISVLVDRRFEPFSRWLCPFLFKK